jgi:HSP20 family molecular chaperone IbpA
LLSIRDDMNRLISEFFGRTEGQEGTWLSGAWAPLVDIHETEDALILTAELPGFSKDDVNVELKDSSLTLKGQQRETAKPTRIAIGGSNAAMGAQYAGMKAAQRLVRSQAAAI